MTVDRGNGPTRTGDPLPAEWNPAPIVAALQLMASEQRSVERLLFDFGAAGAVEVVLDLNPAVLTQEVADGLLAQLAELSLLAAKQARHEAVIEVERAGIFQRFAGTATE